MSTVIKIELFDAIQREIMSMSIDDQTRLLNDCLGELNRLMTAMPEIKGVLKNLLPSTCFFDKDTARYISTVFDVFEIQPTDLLKDIQRGGMFQEPEDEADSEKMIVASSPAPHSVSRTSELTARSSGTLGVPIAVSNNPIDIYVRLLERPGITVEESTEILKIINRITGAEISRKNAETRRTEAETDIMVANARLDRNIERLGLIFTYGAPAAATYFMRESMDKVALTTIRMAAQTSSAIAGTAELGVRNTGAYLIQTALSMGRQARGYLPEFMVQLGKTLKESSLSEYTETSIASEMIEQTAMATAEATDSTILFATILFYIVLTILTMFLCALFGRLRKVNKLYMGFSGVGVEMERRGGSKRASRKRRNTKRNKRSFKCRRSRRQRR